ncbi:MAG: ribonuclease R family protein [Campylobacterota bacterium]|nr:ribonuclease R family protein [Campylobacterota bacterium]
MIEKYLKDLAGIEDFVRVEDGKYRLNSKYKIGKIIVQNKIATLKVGNSSQKIFVEYESLNGSYNNDTVIAKVVFNPKGKTKAKVIKVLESANETILCYFKDNQLYSLKEGVSLEYRNISYSNGDIVLFKNNEIVELFGNLKDSKIDEKISLYLYGELFRLDEFDFSKDFKSKDTQKRVDLTHLDFNTIDPVGAKDYDDAIYFDEETNELFVAIADVSAYVQPNDILDKEARKRSFSIYLPHKVLPMLPFELSNNLCSLVPNEDRLAFVFKIKLDIKNTTVLSSKLFEATINSKQRYTYEAIDEILKKNDKTNKHTKLFEITKRYRKKRLLNGYDFRNDEIRMNLNSEENFKDVKVESSTPSHSLIEECMLLANQEAAKRLNNFGIFRVHEEPSQAKIGKLIEDVNSLGIKAKLKSDIHTTIISIQEKAKNANLESEIDELIIQSQQQAHYGSVKKEHFGLGFKDYSHFTSPIRRYADLVLHRILKTKIIPKDIDEVCTSISDQERQIASLVWDFEDRKYARYAKENIDKIFEAKITDNIKQIATITKELIGARVEIENYGAQKLFTIVNIKIISSDIITKKIICRIV